MIADSSKPNKLRNVYTIRSIARNLTIQKTENLLYQNQRHRAYHKLEETNPFSIERCRSKKRASVSVALALFNCSSGG